MTTVDTEVKNIDTLYNEKDEDTQKDKFLTFQLESESYGIEIRHVTEIVAIQKITALPDVPEYTMGLINLRGKIIPVIDVRIRFHLSQREYDHRTCIIVVNIHNNTVGLIVDSVQEVSNIDKSEIESPPLKNDTQGDFLRGLGKVGKEVKILLDVEKLLFGEELEQNETLIN